MIYVALALGGFAMGCVFVLRAWRRSRAALVLAFLERGPARTLDVADSLHLPPWLQGAARGDLEALERCGLVVSWQKAGGPERQGRPDRLWALSRGGHLP